MNGLTNSLQEVSSGSIIFLKIILEFNRNSQNM